MSTLDMQPTDTPAPESQSPKPQVPQPLQADPGPVRRAGSAVARIASSFYRWLGTRPMPVIIALSVVTGLVVSSVLLIITTAQLRIAWGGLFNHPGNAMSVTGTYLGNFTPVCSRER